MHYDDLCFSVFYAIRCSILYGFLCVTVLYALRISMRDGALCVTVFYSLRRSMRYGTVCITVFYALRWSMRDGALCETVLYALWCSMNDSVPCRAYVWALCELSAMGSELYAYYSAIITIHPPFPFICPCCANRESYFFKTTEISRNVRDNFWRKDTFFWLRLWTYHVERVCIK